MPENSNKMPSFADTYKNRLKNIKFEMLDFGMSTARCHINALSELLYTLQNSHIVVARRKDGKAIKFEAKSRINDTLITLDTDPNSDDEQYRLWMRNRPYDEPYILTLNVEFRAIHEPADVAITLIPVIKKALQEQIALIRAKGYAESIHVDMNDFQAFSKINDRIAIEMDECKSDLRTLFQPGDDYLTITAPTLDESFKVVIDEVGKYRNWFVLSPEAYVIWGQYFPAQYQISCEGLKSLKIERKVFICQSVDETLQKLNPMRRLALYKELPELKGPILHLDEQGMPNMDR